MSTKANARLVNVDASAALAMPGVVGFLDHTSVPGSNLTGHADVEEIFATTQACISPFDDNTRKHPKNADLRQAHHICNF